MVCKEIKPVNLKGNQPWIFIGRTDAEAEAPVLWPPDAKSWLTGKDPDAGKYWRQEKKGTTEDEMIGWHHWLNGHEFEQSPGDGEGQGSLACCSSQGRKDLDSTEQLNSNSRDLDKCSFSVNWISRWDCDKVGRILIAQSWRKVLMELGVFLLQERTEDMSPYRRANQAGWKHEAVVVIHGCGWEGEHACWVLKGWQTEYLPVCHQLYPHSFLSPDWRDGLWKLHCPPSFASSLPVTSFSGRCQWRGGRWKEEGGGRPLSSTLFLELSLQWRVTVDSTDVFQQTYGKFIHSTRTHWDTALNRTRFPPVRSSEFRERLENYSLPAKSGLPTLRMGCKLRVIFKFVNYWPKKKNQQMNIL